MFNNKGKNDIFANIASLNVDLNGRNLIEPQPVDKVEKYLRVNGKSALFHPNTKINTAEQLKKELLNKREYYKDFMKDVARELKNYRHRIEINEFDWRIQDEEQGFNGKEALLKQDEWERVRIPHYGGPLGSALAYYKTKVSITSEMLQTGSLFICFKGVDYKANVFINNIYVGSHEGFFAPFEFEITRAAIIGENEIIVEVQNDYICGGNISEKSNGIRYGGDKIYAATGLGYDEPQFGWHHCPPGMGIYQDVYIESRASVFIKDIFVRPIPEESRAEAWVEIYKCDVGESDISLDISVFGQNFEDEVIKDYIYKPATSREIGLGDSYNETRLRAEGLLDKPVKLLAEKGINYFKIPLAISNMRLWEPDTPWLYQIQIKVLSEKHEVIDTAKRQFGMRSFSIDTENTPKGTFYFNGQKIRLRGANTMGHEQQCVAKKDWDQLIDDLLYAKICNMNFLRLTQRPVQQEVYDYCDKLGLMTQTDLPLFGVLRRNQFCEAVRQAEEMEKLVRSHPCNIIVSYINEPFPNADNKPHRHLTRDELMSFFKAADYVVKMNNPDRVVKHVDGDYDPPSETLPDNHCYNVWYNGNGVDIGKLSKGYWLNVKPGWNYGCGEFGAEGLDPVSVMRKYYPKAWLPQTNEEEKNWTPNDIIGAQSGKFHYCFYETPKTLEEWVKASNEYQAWAIRYVTEAYRRDARMVTFAIHLFIDAFPSGWMKTIMDVERNPKLAYFAYREALTPIMTSLRTDRYKYFEEDDIKFEAWICNDTNNLYPNTKLKYYFEMDGAILGSGEEDTVILDCSSSFQGYIRFRAPYVKERKNITVRLALVNENGDLLHDTSVDVEVFPRVSIDTKKSVYIVGEDEELAVELANELGLDKVMQVQNADIILIDNYTLYKNNEKEIKKSIENGAYAVFMELPEGAYEICGSSVDVKFSSMLPMHFVSRDTGHPLVNVFRPNDFKYWYNPTFDYITPIIFNTFTGDDFNLVLGSGNTNENGEWIPVKAVGEKLIGKGKVFVCQLNVSGRVKTNPIAKMFIGKMLGIWIQEDSIYAE